MWAVTLVHTDDSLTWQRRLRSLSSQEIKLGTRGLKYLCPRETFKEIGELLTRSVPPGLVFTGSSSFHHLSYHFLSRYTSAPLSLVVFDGHGDFFPAPEGYVSCGSWLAEATKIPGVEAVALIGPEHPGNLPAKVLWLPPSLKVRKIPLPTKRVYVSIDKDVLLNATTDWGSGKLSPFTFWRLLLALLKNYEIVGADVCGEAAPRGAWPTDNELAQIRLNEQINLALCRLFLSPPRKAQKSTSKTWSRAKSLASPAANLRHVL